MAEVLMNVFNDIVSRDIALRHIIKNTSGLQQLAVWLVSNTGTIITFDQSDTFNTGRKIIHVLPFYEWAERHAEN